MKIKKKRKRQLGTLLKLSKICHRQCGHQRNMEAKFLIEYFKRGAFGVVGGGGLNLIQKGTCNSLHKWNLQNITKFSRL